MSLLEEIDNVFTATSLSPQVARQTLPNPPTPSSPASFDFDSKTSSFKGMRGSEGVEADILVKVEKRKGLLKCR